MDQQTNLTNFLRTGIVDKLSYDKSIDEICDFLGEPDSSFYPPGEGNENLVVLHYNNLEITFLDKKVALIGITFKQDYGGLPPRLNITWYETVREMDFEKFVNYLRQENIGCKRIVHHLLPSNSLIYLREGSIEVAFDEESRKIEKILSSNLGPPNWQLKDCY